MQKPGKLQKPVKAGTLRKATLEHRATCSCGEVFISATGIFQIPPEHGTHSLSYDVPEISSAQVEKYKREQGR